ncbi:MAG: hypothetical protein ACPGLV_18875, partial [Bacteroidia bacterium]
HLLIPIAKHWGITNSILRNHFFEKATTQELKHLKEIEPFIENLSHWIESASDKNKEQLAFEQTLMAYQELGLWTWDE